MIEPGLDRHEWETQFQALEEDLHDAPAETLPELNRLIERMLDARGIGIDDFVADDGVDPELLTEFRSARETIARLERGDEECAPGDIAAAVNGLVAIYEYLLAQYASP